MPQPPDVAVASDTTLQQQFNQGKATPMQPTKGNMNADDSSILGPAFSAFGRKLMLVVVVIALLTLVSVLVFEEMEKSERNKIRQLPASNVAPIKVDHPRQDEGVVTKENWKHLQLKADRAREERLRIVNPRARSIQERAAMEAEEREHKAVVQMQRNSVPITLPTNSVSARSGGWAKKAGMRPHSGAQTDYGHFW